MTDTIKATIYHKPNGRKEQIELTNIYSEDAKYINDNDIKVSLEQLDYNDFAIYFDYGLVDEDDEPIEHIELTLGKSCEETINKAINTIKNYEARS